MNDPRMTGTKLCSKCQKDLPVICFSVDRKKPDGLSCSCRDCIRQQKKQKHTPGKANKKTMLRAYIKLGQGEDVRRKP